VAAGGTECVVLPGDSEGCRAALLQLQVTARSLLGAVVLNSGGMLLHHGWLRVYGGAGGELPSLAEVNGFPPEVDPTWAPQAGLILAHDVLGGVFALNGMDAGRYGRPGEPGQVVYFAPDSLEWEDMEGGYSEFLQWCLTGNLQQFYEGSRWLGWRDDVQNLPGDKVFNFYPFLCAQAPSIEARSRAAVAIEEAWGLWIGTDLLGDSKSDGN
jgi:hypothetical protein